MNDQPQPHILDDVLTARMEAEREDFDPQRVVSELLADLPLRARNIVFERFGLSGKPKKTLEELGAMYNITRERVRQIESHSVATFSEPAKRRMLEPVMKLVSSLLYENGEIMEEEALLKLLLPEDRNTSANRSTILFLMEFLKDFTRIPATRTIRSAWSLRGVALDHAKRVIDAVVHIFSESQKPLAESDLAALLESNEDFSRLVPGKNPKALFSYLSLSKKVSRNPFGQWGLAEWSEVVPKGVRDKAFLVMREHKKPIHFQDITNLINKTGFDSRTAHPQTVHNELIKDSRFVLVGRGMYALKEWGYGEGTVADILIRILKNASEPVQREALIAEVLKQRLVKRNTIIIGLQDKTRFKKLPGNKYVLVESEQK